jgi:hypothetical protein
VLWAAQEMSNTEIAHHLHCTKAILGKWRQRFLQYRLVLDRNQKKMRSGPEQASSRNTTILVRSAHLALLIVMAIALTFPCLRQGLPDGQDTNPHLTYQHFFNEQVSSGDLYPRWMPGLNRGLGGGIFFMQYPLPYYVAWGFAKIIPQNFGIYTETRTQGMGLALATILAALFTYAWCVNFSDGWSALTAAVVYMTLPYFLTIDLYTRVSVGEFWALSLLPMTFFFIERMSTAPRRSLAGLAVAFALVILSHLFTAALLAPVLPVYAIWRAKPPQRVSAAVLSISAEAIASGVAGVYTLPAIVHRGFMHPLNFITAYGSSFSPLSQMFPYNAFLFPKASRGLRILGRAARVLGATAIGLIVISWYSSRKEKLGLLRLVLAVLSVLTLLLTVLAGHLPISGEVSGALPMPKEIVELREKIFVCSFLTLEVALLSYWSLRNRLDRGPADFLIVLALASYLMMTSWSQLAWRTFRFLWNVQFPWRLNTFLVPATAGLAALAFSELRTALPWRRTFGGILALVVWGVVAGGTAKLGPVQRAFRAAISVTYQPGTDLTLPIYTQVDPRGALLVMPTDDEKIHVAVVEGSGHAVVSSTRPRLIELQAKCESDCTLQISQFYYPAWRARLLAGAAEIPLSPASPGGLMEVSLPPGEYAVELELPRGWSERIGLWLSLLSLGTVVFLTITANPPRVRARLL